MKFNIRLLYLYLFSLVGLIITTIGAVRLVELGLKVYVFKDADRFDYYTAPAFPVDKINVSTESSKIDEAKQKEIQDKETTRQRQREASGAIAMLIVGLPLYKYHWSIIQKENMKPKP
jgi:hypothetical protein